MKRNVESMDKSQYLEEIKSTAENCYNIGYKRGHEAAFGKGKAGMFAYRTIVPKNQVFMKKEKRK